MLKKLWSERKQALMGFLLAISLTACAGALMTGSGCKIYSEYRVNMPDPTGASREYLEWFNLMDKNMFEVCKKGE